MYYGEKLNSITHLIGLTLSVSGLVILVTLAAMQGDAWKAVSFSVYGATLVLLYGFSTIYHSVKSPPAKAFLRRLDHNAIYFYMNDEKVRHYHGVWHLFVLGGSFCHFVCILLYVA